MSWIEGVGDEVTLTVAVIAVLVIVVVAWLSTGIRDIPFIRVVVVQLTRRRHQPRTDAAVERIEAELLVREPDNVLEVDNSNDNEAEQVAQNESSENSLDSTGNEVSVGDSASANALETKETNVEEKTDCENNEADENTALENEEDISPVTVENLSASELRQRRVEFFKDPTQSSSRTDSGINNADQCVENKANDSKETGEKLGTSNEKAKESETETNKSLKSKRLSDLASNLLNEELENSRKEQTGSRNSQSETSRNENQSTGTGSETEIRVRLKYLNDTQRLVTASPSETIGNFRRKHFTDELSQSKLVRFIFNGQDLRNDNSTLRACNIIDNSVVHCLITQPQQQQAQAANHQEDGFFDIGHLMVPLFGILLGIVWYFRFMYRQFFNVTSTLTLGGITFLYIAALMSSLRGNRPHQHLE